MTLKNKKAPLLFYFMLCASFRNHWWIQTWVTVRKRPIRVKIGNFLSCVTLKFDRWPWKTIAHLFYDTSSFVQHFIGIGELKLELQFGNAQFGSKSVIFCPVWPWNSPFRELAARGTCTNQIAASWMLQATWLATVASRHIVWQALLISL